MWAVTINCKSICLALAGKHMPLELQNCFSICTMAGAPAAGQHTPDFLKLFLCGHLYVCVCVCLCVCVSALEAINN